MPANPDYPDVLKVITAERLSLDVADLAFGLKPAEITAGRPFDALLIVQNTADCEIDAQVKLNLPEKDLKGVRNRFTTKADKRIVVGLLPGEVGYVSLPVLANPQTAPGSGYALQLEVEIKRQARKANRVRNEKGGSALQLADLPEPAQAEINQLKTLQFSAATSGRPSRTSATLSVSFTINPPGISRVEEPSRAGWHSLWTMHDNLDQTSLAERARPLTATVLPQINRNNLFFPLLRSVQEHCERADYRLWAGEALMLTKLMMLVLETGLPVATAGEEAAPYPHWFTKLCQLLLQKPELATHIELLVTDLLFPDLVYDAAMSGFTMVATATTEDLGNPDEMADYATALFKSLAGEGEPLDFVHTYLPLVLGGVMAHDRVMMPKEQPLDALELLINARLEREAERHDGNQFVFTLADDLTDRALKRHDTSLQRYLDPIERMRYQRPGQPG